MYQIPDHLFTESFRKEIFPAMGLDKIKVNNGNRQALTLMAKKAIRALALDLDSDDPFLDKDETARLMMGMKHFLEAVLLV